jgi:predicted nuclease of predicted toxin-antitoxin system
MILLLKLKGRVKLLLDQGLPRSTASILCEKGFDAVHVGNIGHASSTDARILELAQIENRTLITLDADFHTILALSGALSPSIIRIRIEGLKGVAMASLIQSVLEQCKEHVEKGASITVQRNCVRVRLLPILIN